MLTPYTTPTNIIGSLGTDPEDRPDLDDQDLKNKFDQNAVNIVSYVNLTLKPEVDKIDSKDEKEVSYITATVSRSLTTDDLYKWVLADHASVPIVFTVPANLTTEMAWIVIEQTNAAQVSISAGPGVTIKPARLKINGQDTSAALVHKGSNVWSWQGSVKA
jgi:hypothetical protein